MTTRTGCRRNYRRCLSVRAASRKRTFGFVWPQRLRIETLEPRLLLDGSNYAVLFSGGGDAASNFPRYYNNLTHLYDVLTADGGPVLSSENVFILYADGLDSAPDQPGDVNSEITF